MSCPICEKRPPKRFCPAKGEKICAVCCGRERESTIDCPPDCSYLIAAHRYEAEHRAPLSAADLPYPKVDLSMEFVYQRWPIVSGLANAIISVEVKRKELNDGDVLAALEAAVETYRTLETGILYERPPDAPGARTVYFELAEHLRSIKKQAAEPTGFSTIKDSEILRLLVFLLRVGKQQTNGRPRSRAFLGFLRSRFPRPAGAAASSSPSIIVP
jgi:hypothetical protein